MSDDAPTTDEQSWPTHCERCGHELESAAVDVMPGGDETQTTVIAQDFCPNPDCPGRSEQPGSMGGDNGGA